MTNAVLVLTCTGRAVDDRLQPVGDPCGATFRRDWRFLPQEADLPWPPPSELVPDDVYILQARRTGWLVITIGGELLVTCPKCRKPAPAVTALVRDSERRPR